MKAVRQNGRSTIKHISVESGTLKPQRCSSVNMSVYSTLDVSPSLGRLGPPTATALHIQTWALERFLMTTTTSTSWSNDVTSLQVCCSLMLFKLTRNSSGDEIANVNS